MTANPYKSYSSNQLDNESPAEQISALFSKAAEHMQVSVDAISDGDVFVRWESSQKAITILEGLMNSLNRETPERIKIAQDLETYYKTMINLISRVNIHNDIEVCRSLVEGFQDMAVFWKEAGQVLESDSQYSSSIIDKADIQA